MFHQSFNPFVRLDIPLRMPREISPRQKRKSLARRLEEQERELQQLSFEELPMEMQLPKSKDVKDESSDRHDDDSSCRPHLLDEDANNSLGSCPITQSASGPPDDGDLLDDAPDSPMTYPPRTVMVRTLDPHATPKIKNGVHRKRIFSLDFSTICTERGETSDGDKSLDEEDDISRGEDPSATSFDHEDDGDDEWDDTLTYGTAATYPPRSIVLVPNNHLDVIATPLRSRTYRSYSSDLSSSSSHGGQNSSPSHHPLPFPTLPKLEESQLWAHDDEYFEPLYKFDLTTEETDEDEDQIPHVMSCPEIFGDTDDDISEVPFDDTEGHQIGLIVHFIESASCPGRVSTPGRLSTEGSIASLEI